MQKVVKFLEQNVEWLAVGLGVLFFGWMVWGWVVTPPATVMVANQPQGPGDVDPYIDQNAAQQLLAQVNDKSPDPTIPAAPKNNVNDFIATMSNSTAPAVKLASGMFGNQVYIPDQNDQQNGPIPGRPMQPQNPGAPGAVAKITALPSLPPAEVVGVGAGLSSIQPPANAVAIVPAATGANGQPLPLDKAWATATFRLPMAEIAKSFAAVQVPPGTKSLVLQIEMMREEQQPDGTWGPETLVRAIPVPGQIPYPIGGAKGLEFTYRQWADQNEANILQPVFYTVVGGTPWLPPGLPTVASATPQQAFDPANYTGPLDALTPEQRQAVLKARQQKAIEKAKNAPKPQQRGGNPFRGGPAGAGGAPGAAGAMVPTELPFLALPAPRPVGGVIPAGDAAMAQPDMTNPDNGGGNGGAPPPPGLTPEAQQMLQNRPTSSFDPATPAFSQGVIVWAHDDNADAGKTYRYKMHYKMLNPGYVQPGLFVNTKLALQFDVISADSAWTTAVDVPAQTTFYVSRNPLSNGVPFDVYHWQNGQLRSKALTIGVGDMIGAPDGDTDYTTGWTVTDIRSDPRGGTYVLLTDNAGKMIRRDFSTDSKDPKYLAFKAQIAALKAQTNPQQGNPNNPAAGG